MYHTISSRAWLAFVLLLPALAMAQFTNCTLPPHNATSILDLRPGDIKVVMAMGDSITTGFGLRDSFNESYGASFSIGGDLGAVTIANFLHYFNADLAGFSTGTYPAQVCYGQGCPSFQYSAGAEANNAAKSGAMVQDMTSVQTSYLISQLNANPNINIANDWKVLTIMTGMNDLCASCTFNLPFLDPNEYQMNLMATLERIRTSVPRVFVNLVAGFNVSQAYDLSLTMPSCNNISRPLFIECDCIFKPENGPIRESIDAAITQFNERAQLVAQYYQRKAFTDFAVVVQPFATNTHISDLPDTFLSDLDCFHPSTAGQQAMAVALWNNMLSPSASKKTVLDMADTPICPTPTTLLYTY